MEPFTMKVKVGRYLYPVKVTPTGGRFEFSFRYNESIMADVKVMEGAKWHGRDEKNPRKIWSVKDSPHNRFRIAFMAGQKPYEPYDRPIPDFLPSREQCYSHQRDITAFELARRCCIIAGEMGTGKTLATIECMEASKVEDWWWIGPKLALNAVQLEFDVWKAGIRPRYHSYDALRKIMEDWTSGRMPPQAIVFDESSRLKNPHSQRSQAARYLTDLMRQRFGDQVYIILMSGTPAPKDPTDWWNQCEIACPGFLKEGSIQAFKKRLCIIEQREAITGGVYPHVVTWKDDEKKCDECGRFQEDARHEIAMGGHTFKPSKNEVAYLYKRMNGLVLVKFKKDCLDLPEKRYVTINLKPSLETMRLASIIEAKAVSAINALTLLRELSDGFQYREEVVGSEICHICNGSKVMKRVVDLDEPELPLDGGSLQAGHRIYYDEAGTPIGRKETPLRLEEQIVACESCYGTGVVEKKDRTIKEMPSPKEEALKELIDHHEECGRLVIYAGFTASVERCVRVVRRMGWDYIRLDGRGVDSSLQGLDSKGLLKAFQYDKSIERVAVVGQPGAAGMGLNLTASPSIVYYSNDFNGESRTQSEDRIHRPGADHNRGCTIYDLIHLASDQLVLDNLRKKRKLETLTLGQLRDELKDTQFIGEQRVL